MRKRAKTQWDFGELFPTETTRSAPPAAPAGEPAAAAQAREVLTVAELTLRVKQLLETQIGQIWVTGEVTNLRAQSSGHRYFTLKDAESQLSCVLFRNEARDSRNLLQDGRKVVLQGELTVYEPRGQYQLRVTAVELQGIGVLQAAFEKLKQRLQAEGLFAQERKRPLPPYPQRIGIVSSPTGAAIKDVLHVVRRRQPGLQMVLAPARVQGDGAAAEIADAIKLLNEFSARAGNGLDLILITRGGGSFEDLWAFNEEVVARAIFESKLPVVSAVGHEIDFTISDFVADVRAATPSAAAELITEGVFSSSQFVAEAGGRLRQLCRQQVEDKRDDLAQQTRQLARLHPRRCFNEWLQQLDDLQTGLVRCVKQSVRDRRNDWRNLRERLARVRPALVLSQRRELLERHARQLTETAVRQFETKQTALAAVEARLRLLGPEQVLGRGYSITMDAATGRIVRAAGDVKPGQRLKTRLKSGEIRSRAED